MFASNKAEVECKGQERCETQCVKVVSGVMRLKPQRHGWNARVVAVEIFSLRRWPLKNSLTKISESVIIRSAGKCQTSSKHTKRDSKVGGRPNDVPPFPPTHGVA